MGPEQADRARDALAKQRNWLMTRDGVVGTGVGEHEGGACILVMVDPGRLEPGSLPAWIEGFPVRLVPTGPARAREQS